MSNFIFPVVATNQSILADLSQKIQENQTPPVSQFQRDDGGSEIIGSLNQGNVFAGSTANDFATGGNQADAVDGGDGNDIILGLKGDDILRTYAGTLSVLA
ncbi:hypothetical protein [Planktothrix agardhii]|uniref:hypothetical protein n=1 Tax=Planktothrix agardhii TaxID=1160 RepID=UPI00222366E1|nr:hypothetical protein [Planktothrix agardhii]